MTERLLLETELRRDVARWKLRVTWTWTNWTVGVWWDRRRKGWPVRSVGLDLGPFEVVGRRLLTGPRTQDAVVHFEPERGR